MKEWRQNLGIQAPGHLNNFEFSCLIHILNTAITSFYQSNEIPWKFSPYAQYGKSRLDF